MALTTAFTEMFGVRHPIALAPMGGFTGGALTAAVSNGGGLGLLGAGYGDAASSPPRPSTPWPAPAAR